MPARSFWGYSRSSQTMPASVVLVATVEAAGSLSMGFSYLPEVSLPFVGTFSISGSSTSVVFSLIAMPMGAE